MTKETRIARSLRLMFSGSIVLGLGAFSVAQAQTAAEAPLQRVEITGSSIKRAQVEGATPVQTVTREDIAKLGVTSTDQLLSSISSNANVGAVNQAQGAGTTTYGESTASLRGIGSSKTLVLVNGRRLANYATDGTSVDINSIPLAAVDHVEILKDGASGVYGSDAIGGVINFILRNNFRGTEVNAYTGATKDGGGATNKASILVGFGDYDDDRYNITLSADVAKDKAIYGNQRRYSQNSWSNDGRFDNSATPSGNLTTFVPTNQTNAMGIVPNSLASLGSSIGNPLSTDNCAANGSGFDANFPSKAACRYNSAPLVPLAPQIERQNLAGSFRFKLNDSTEVFMEGFHSHQKTTMNEQASPYSNSFLETDTAFAKQNVYPSIILSPSSPYYPAAYIASHAPAEAGKPVSVSYRAVDAGGRSYQDIGNQTHLVIGTRGTVKGYDYDVAYTHNASDVTESTMRGYQNQVQLVQLLSNNSAFNPYTQNQSPELAAQIRATNYNGQMINSTLTNDSLAARASGDLYQLPAGMAKFALGASLSDESLKYNPSVAYQSGDISGYGGQALPLSASRNSSAIFGEVIVPLLKTLEADLAVRTDKYPDAKATNPKISLRYQPMQQLLVRASYGKGFRVAALPELNTPVTNATTATFIDPATGTRGQFSEIIGGNSDLKPEKSEQASLGFVIDPVKGLSVALDFWKINVNNLITTYDPEFLVDQAAAGVAAYQGFVQRDAAGNISRIVNTNINANSLKTAGVDLDVRWAILKSATLGNFSTRLNGTYVSKYDETLIDGSVQHSVAATLTPSGDKLNAVATGGIIFRWKHQLTLDWKYKEFGLGLAQNFQSGYYDNVRADSATGTDAQRVGAFSTWDLNGSYSGVKNLVVRAGVKNLFNRMPPAAITAGQYFQAGYDPSYYDAHGATGYVSANYRF
jgi:iron complex outermembrane receptor protein